MGPILVRHYCGVVNQLVWMLDGWRRNDEKRTSWMPAWISVRFDSTVDYCSRYKSLLYCIVVGLSSAWHVNDVMIRCEKFQLYWRHSLALSDVILRNTHTLHWLPVRKKMDFKIATFVYRSLSGTAPAYWPLTVICRLKKVVVSCVLPTQGLEYVSSGGPTATLGTDVSRLSALSAQQPYWWWLHCWSYKLNYLGL